MKQPDEEMEASDCASDDDAATVKDEDIEADACDN